MPICKKACHIKPSIWKVFQKQWEEEKYNDVEGNCQEFYEYLMLWVSSFTGGIEILQGTSVYASIKMELDLGDAYMHGEE